MPIIQGHHVDRDRKHKQLRYIRDAHELELELQHCIPLCSNHHDLYEYETRNGGKGLDVASTIELVRQNYPMTS